MQHLVNDPTWSADVGDLDDTQILCMATGEADLFRDKRDRGIGATTAPPSKPVLQSRPEGTSMATVASFFAAFMASISPMVDARNSAGKARTKDGVDEHAALKALENGPLRVELGCDGDR